MKTCSSCGISKDLNYFHRASKSKDGLQSICKDCRNAAARVYASENKQKYRDNHKVWLSLNRESSNESKRLRRLKNKDAGKVEKQKQYTAEERKARYLRYKQDPEWLGKHREFARQYQRTKRNNIFHRIENQIRCRTAIAIGGGPKLGKYEKYIGCSTQELKDYLEGKFKPGMRWDNWGRGEDKWHVDHILPVSSFDLSVPEQFFKAFHFLNLQPLWETENLSKGRKVLRASPDAV